MLQRLQSVKPVYRISDWIDDWQRSEELTQRITAYPSIPTVCGIYLPCTIHHAYYYIHGFCKFVCAYSHIIPT